VQNVYDINELIKKKRLPELQADLAKNGWVFVNLPPDLVAMVKEIIDPLNKFFKCPSDIKQNYAQDMKLNPGIPLGYGFVKHKESLHYLTANRFDKTLIPDTCSNSLTRIIQNMDILMHQLALAISPKLFGYFSNTIATMFDLPSLNETSTDLFGMFDIAYYLNDPSTGGPKDYNCAPHYDPGLFSLSILATTSGLELQNYKGEWIKGPTFQSNPTLGVIWLGEAAVKASKNTPIPLVAGVHKVSYSNLEEKIPRLTMWYEICTSAQLMDNTDGMFLTEDNKPAIKVKNIIGTDIIVGKTSNATKSDLLYQIETEKGIPMSKSGLVNDNTIKNNNNSSGFFSFFQNMFGKLLETDTGVPMSKSLYESPHNKNSPLFKNN